MTIDELPPALPERLSDMLGARVRLDVLRAGTQSVDGAAMLIARGTAEACVVHLSSAEFPEVAAENGARAREFACAVGPVLAAPVVLPIGEGRIDGRSFAAMPYHRPFGAGRVAWRYQRFRIETEMLDWLAALAATTTGAGIAATLANLDALTRVQHLDRPIAEAAARWAAELRSFGITARAVPMHGDLWPGNILTAPWRSGRSFSLIDWAASQVAGHPIFDLVRFAAACRLSPRALRDELERHAPLLGCSTTMTEAWLLAALGHFASNRGLMPSARFEEMARDCFTLHQAAMRCS